MMARFLQKLGHGAYRRRKTTLAIWTVILLMSATFAVLFMGKLANTFTLPGTETERVLNLMAQELPELSGGSGTVVFATADGTEFTPEQKAAIAEATSKLASLDFVAQAADPFETQKALDEVSTQIADGRAELAKNEAKLADGESALEAGRKQLEAGKKEFAAGEAEVRQNEPKLRQGREQLEAARPELESAAAALQSARSELDSGEAQYQAGVAEFAAGQKEISTARAQLEAATGQVQQKRAEYDAGVAQLTQTFGVADLQQAGAAIDALQVQVSDGLATAQGQKLQAEQALASLQQKKAGLEAEGNPVPPELLEGIAKAEQAVAAVNAAISELTSQAASLEQARQVQQQLLAAGPELDAAEKQLADSRAQVDAGAAELEKALGQLTQARNQLDAGWDEYNAGLAEYQAGKEEFDRNEAELVAGEQALQAGLEKLADARKEIAENEKKIEAAAAELEDGRAQLDAGREELERGERQAKLAAPIRFVAEDGTAAISQVQFKGQVDALTDTEREQLTAVTEIAEAQGVEMLYSQEILRDLNSIFGVAEAVGFIVAAIVLLVVLGTVVAAGLPLLVALFGVAIGVCTTLALSSTFDMQNITPVLALMLGLAVGIDYSLFIVHRHRTQLLAGMPVEQSVALAIGTSGNAVVFAGLTVVIALAALVVPGLPFLSVLGLSAAFTVFVAVLLSITLTPALLGFMGERVLTKKGKAARAEALSASQDANAVAAASERHNAASRWWGAVVTRYAGVAVIAVVIVLGIIAIPAASMKTALPDGGSEPEGSDAQRAFTVVTESFGAGFNGPLLVMAKLPENVDSAGADEVLLEVGEQLAQKDGVVAAVPVTVNDALTYGALQVIPEGGPSSPETGEVVHDIRGSAPEIAEATGAEISVTGQVAAQIDVSEKITQALVPYLIIVVGLSLILLLLVFRSVVIPLLATGGFLLSLAASFGATVAIYQWGWLGPVFDVHNPGPILSFLPILLTGILFGLAMDYQVFIVTAMREAYVAGGKARRAVRQGFSLAAPVVVAAALIMISVFAGFIFSHLAMIRPLGFGLAIGVLFDAFFVRMTFIPATMQLLGSRAWYLPKWLDRVLPHVDVEGSALQRNL